MQIDMNKYMWDRVHIFVMKIKEGDVYVDSHDGANHTFSNENLEEMVDIVNEKYNNTAFPLNPYQRHAERWSA